MSSADKWGQILWDYALMHQPLEQADLIFAFGSHDIRVAEWAAELYLQGYAPLILFSGGFGRITKDAWNKPEAEIFAEIALEKGVPPEKILIEREAANAGENILLSKTLLEEKGLQVQKVIAVQKPYAERRAYAALRQRWPEIQVIPSSPPITFINYPNKDISKDEMLNVMVGDLQRMKLYAEKGFQVPQHIPEEVWEAYEQLVQLGYDKQLVK